MQLDLNLPDVDRGEGRDVNTYFFSLSISGTVIWETMVAGVPSWRWIWHETQLYILSM